MIKQINIKQYLDNLTQYNDYLWLLERAKATEVDFMDYLYREHLFRFEQEEEYIDARYIYNLLFRYLMSENYYNVESETVISYWLEKYYFDNEYFKTTKANDWLCEGYPPRHFEKKFIGRVKNIKKYIKQCKERK